MHKIQTLMPCTILPTDALNPCNFEIRESNKMAGKSLSSLKFRDNILIAAIIRKGKTIYPTGEDVLQVGDKIVVVTFLKNITRIYDLLAR